MSSDAEQVTQHQGNGAEIAEENGKEVVKDAEVANTEGDVVPKEGEEAEAAEGNYMCSYLIVGLLTLHQESQCLLRPLLMLALFKSRLVSALFITPIHTLIR